MMTTSTNFVAFDLGASSGRAVVGQFDGETLSLQEAHRFHNGPTRLLDSLYWDAPGLFNEMKSGLRKVATDPDFGGEIAAFGLDTWGVDFGLLDRTGSLVGNPYHYRDSATDGILEKAYKIVTQAEIFAETGIQFIQFNTLFQLLSMSLRKAPALEIADSLLMMPDLFNYWFTGVKASEFTIASTSHCYNMQSGQWAIGLMERLGLPTHIFQQVVQPGTQLGTLLPHITEEVGLSSNVPVIAPGCHDTASAVAAVPVSDADKDSFAYLSSGTWSLLGVETPSPVINETSLAYNFTNEGGVENTIRLLKNLGGLWFVQECRRVWALQGEEYSFAELTDMATAAKPFAAIFDPDDPVFLAPGDMPARIADYCRQSGQTPPVTKGEFIRCSLESLALKYRWAVERLEELTGHPITVMHIVGGGTQNRLLNQFSANAIGRRVVTGPVEATAIGNILMQMLAVGQISSLSEGREVVKRSFPVEEYLPQNTEAWDEVYPQFLKLLG